MEKFGNIVVGQEVVVERRCNAARGRKGDELYFMATVKTIGRKWFTLEPAEGSREYLDRERFSLENGIHDGGDYSPQYCVYVDYQAVKDRDERKRLVHEILNASGSKLHEMDLGRLREVHGMIFGGVV